MFEKTASKLSDKKRYLQIALNSTLNEASAIIRQLPVSDRIIVEAGTPLIKRYGEDGIRQIKQWYSMHLVGLSFTNISGFSAELMLNSVFSGLKYRVGKKPAVPQGQETSGYPYVVADLKMMDRGETEVEMSAQAGADAAVALGAAPVESLDAFVQKCEDLEIDAMIDMMNVDFPLTVLRQLKKQPRVVILHRGVDEERFNKEKQIPLHEIRRIKGTYNMMIAIAGGDTIREVQRSIFNDADIVVVWKSFFQSTKETAKLAADFLAEIK